MARRSKTRELISAYLRKLGSKGGKARAAKHSKQELSQWAKKGGRPPKKKGD